MGKIKSLCFVAEFYSTHKTQINNCRTKLCAFIYSNNVYIFNVKINKKLYKVQNIQNYHLRRYIVVSNLNNVVFQKYK